MNIALCDLAYYSASDIGTAYVNKSILFPTIATTKFYGPFYFSSSIHILSASKDYLLFTSYITMATRASL